MNNDKPESGTSAGPSAGPSTTWTRARRPKSSRSSKDGGRKAAAVEAARRPTIHRRRLPLFGRLDRYVLSHFVQSYLTAMLLMTGLFMVIDMASNLDNYVEPWEDGTSVPVSVLLRFYILNLSLIHI